MPRVLVVGALCASLASGFAPARPARHAPASLAATASEVESYQKLMSDYLVKSHEQRIKAVADARTQATQDADARIHQLEHELSSLLGAPAPSGGGREARGRCLRGALGEHGDAQQPMGRSGARTDRGVPRRSAGVRPRGTRRARRGTRRARADGDGRGRNRIAPNVRVELPRAGGS